MLPWHVDVSLSETIIETFSLSKLFWTFVHFRLFYHFRFSLNMVEKETCVTRWREIGAEVNTWERNGSEMERK